MIDYFSSVKFKCFGVSDFLNSYKGSSILEHIMSRVFGRLMERSKTEQFWALEGKIDPQ